MQEQLISQETFELARSKGCTLEKCICGRFPECICTDKRITQSLLAKWLREKYNIHIYPICTDSNYNYEYKCAILYGGVVNYTEDYDTYEQALEAALQEGLKLIK